MIILDVFSLMWRHYNAAPTIYCFHRVSTDCPEIVDKFISSVADLTGNTSATSSGTVVHLYCLADHVLVGSEVLRCVEGRWDRPVPRCVLVMEGMWCCVEISGNLMLHIILNFLAICISIIFCDELGVTWERMLFAVFIITLQQQSWF